MNDATAELLLRAVEPTCATADVPGIGGRSHLRLEDFVVREIAAYPADGRAGHVFVRMTKRGMTTDAAVEQLARQLELPRAAIGVAGLKDKQAVTEQWISLPDTCVAALAQFEHPSITLGTPAPHGAKLRRGHLRGNEFRIVLREFEGDLERTVQQAQRKLAALAELGGLENAFGPQRFGREGNNAVKGLEQLRRGRRPRRGDIVVAAAQAALFNAYLLQRRSMGSMRRVMLGDVLKKTDTGGLFTSDDSERDQARFDRGELAITGPMFGSKTMSPPDDTPAAQLEAYILSQFELDKTALRALGKALPGTRRLLQVDVSGCAVSLEAAIEGLAPGLSLEFALPAGSYATQLLRELQGT